MSDHKISADGHEYDPEPYLEYVDDEGNVESEFMCIRCPQVKIVRSKTND